MIRTSEELDELAAALSKAQAAMDDAAKDTVGQVGQQKTRYADLAAVRAASRQPLAANGLSYVQFPSASEPGTVTIITRLLHASGQWIEDDAGITMPAGNTAQSTGSAVTYARRYSLMAVLGIAADDDDGHAATQATTRRTPAEHRNESPYKEPQPPSHAEQKANQADHEAKPATSTDLRRLAIAFQKARYDDATSPPFLTAFFGRDITCIGEQLTHDEIGRVIDELGTLG